jgi:hypothetical protein
MKRIRQTGYCLILFLGLVFLYGCTGMSGGSARVAPCGPLGDAVNCGGR